MQTDAVIVHVVRHACAGSRDDWSGPDVDRPLDEIGREQAMVVADRLAPLPVSDLFASPARRCAETLAPLADRLGRPVECVDVLGPDATADALLEFLVQPGRAGAVCCSHGESMSALLGLLRQAGTVVAGQVGDDALLAKGTVWSLTVAEGASVTSLRLVVPTTLSPRSSGPGDGKVTSR